MAARKRTSRREFLAFSTAVAAATAAGMGQKGGAAMGASVVSGSGNPLQLWLYYSTNLLVPRNIDALEKVWRKAARIGYSHILLTDSKFAILGSLGGNRPKYLAHVKRVREIAADLHLQLAPTVFQLGYSNDLLANNPHLAEGLPVRNVSFVVHGQVGRVAADPAANLSAKPDWHDPTVHVHGHTATIHSPHANARISFQRQLKPFHAYHVSLEIRTDGFSRAPKLAALGKNNRNLQYEDIKTKPHQPWQRYDLVFNTLEETDIKLYLGTWGKSNGTLELRNWTMEVAGLVNPLGRPGAPTVVRGYRPGSDYLPISDPLLGMQPYRGQYQPWHKPVDIHFIRKIPDGTRVEVSWFYPPIIYGGEVTACPSSPEMRRLFAQEARDMRNVLPTHGYMMDFDEIRTLNQDDSCRKLHKTAGEILASTTRYCTDLLHGAQSYTWTDMFDPFHNAHDHYFLVRGTLAGSWKGLSPETIVFNWNGPQRVKSLRWFERLGNKQIIATYYDAPLSHTQAWVRAAKGIKGVLGYMYTTWSNDYKQIEPFAKLVRGG